ALHAQRGRGGLAHDVVDGRLLLQPKGTGRLQAVLVRPQERLQHHHQALDVGVAQLHQLLGRRLRRPCLPALSKARVPRPAHPPHHVVRSSRETWASEPAAAYHTPSYSMRGTILAFGIGTASSKRWNALMSTACSSIVIR